MGVFDQQTIDEIIRNATQRGASSTTGAGTTTTTPGAASPYAALLESLGKTVEQVGGSYGGAIDARLNEAISQASTAGPVPEFKSGNVRGALDAYTRLLDPAAERLSADGTARLSGDPRLNAAIGKLYATAENPIDDDLETYFGDRFRRETDSNLARLGLVGQGRGADLRSEADTRYARERTNVADTRRINAATAGSSLTGAQLDQALKSLTTGAGMAGASFNAKDTAEQQIYNNEMQTYGVKKSAPYDELMRIAQIGAARVGLAGAPSNLYGTLYGMDQARLARGGTTSTVSNLTGATSGSGTDSRSGSTTTSPSAFDALSGTLKLVPQVTQAVGALAPLASGAYNALSGGGAAAGAAESGGDALSAILGSYL